MDIEAINNFLGPDSMEEEDNEESIKEKQVLIKNLLETMDQEEEE